jgi:hypothetical protein
MEDLVLISGVWEWPFCKTIWIQDVEDENVGVDVYAKY